VAARAEAKNHSRVLYRIEANLTAGEQMSHLPGLRPRVEALLTGILETAHEIHRSQGIDVGLPAREPMHLRIGDYAVYYLLEIDRRMARIVGVETMKPADSHAR
jgi:hypothetical protein